MNARRTCRLAGQALREAAHLRLPWVLALAALTLVAGVSVLREFNFGMEEARFFQDLTEGTVILFGTVQATLLMVTIVHGGLAKGLPGLLFTRGVRRSEWLVASLAAVWVSLAWLTLTAHGLLGLLLSWHGHAVSIPALAVECGQDVLRLGLVAGFALSACVVSRSALLATTLALGLTLAAQLAPIVEWAGQHSPPAARLFWTILGRLVPNLSALDGGVGAVVYAGGYIALYTVAACVAFAHREL